MGKQLLAQLRGGESENGGAVCTMVAGDCDGSGIGCLGGTGGDAGGG